MTAAASRERIAAMRTWPGGPSLKGLADLLATAEWGWDEHDRAERLAAQVDGLRCDHCGEVGCDWIGDIRKARAETAEAALDAVRPLIEAQLRERLAAAIEAKCRTENHAPWAPLCGSCLAATRIVRERP